MELREAPVDVQLRAFKDFISTNPVVAAIIDRMPSLELPDCWLAAGCLFQTVWNTLSRCDPEAGILDYDLNYFDATDLSWEAEDHAIRSTSATLDDLGANVELRNEARVHLWYESKFGTPCPAYRNTRHAISTFPNCSSCLGVRPAHGELEVFAPYGLTDLFAMTTRPNPVLAPASVYQKKTARWAQQWPNLTVLPWPTR